MRISGWRGPGGRSASPSLLLGSALLLALPVTAAPQSPGTAGGPEAAPGSIRAADLRAHVGVLAHDSMRGRQTPSPGLEKTARYVAERFREYGLRPGLGSDGYQQWYPVTVIRPADPGRQMVRLQGPDRERTLDHGRDFVAAPTGRSVRAVGQLRAWDPDSGERPPTDGLLVVPVDPSSIVDRLQQVRSVLSDTDAEGALVAVDAPRGYFRSLRDFFASERVSLGQPDALDEPVVLVRRSSLPEALTRMLERGWGAVAGWKGELRTEASVEAARAMNTIGWIQGSDPELRNEYVVFTAHMDHLGVGRPVDGDSIYNGADDDASGTATILELARAFASGSPPRRSLVFMTVSGEERGLLGSRWYTEHPVFPLERTVANINIDMVGRNWRDTVVAIGKDVSTLGRTVDRVAEENPELGLAVVDDQWPERNYFYRSDHYNFARNGVPVLFFFSGTHEDYHQPGDEADKLDYGKTARVARLVRLLGRQVADARRRPEWDPEAYRRVVREGPER